MKNVSIEERAVELAQIPESIEIKKVFLAEKNPIVRLGLLIK